MQNRFHVLMLTSFFNPNIGGIEKHTFYLIRGLLRKGHKVTLITSNIDPYLNSRIPYIKSDSLSVVPIPILFRPLNNPVQLGIIKQILSVDSDLIHVHDHYYYGSLISSLLKAAVKKPLIVTYHTSKLKFENPIKNFIVKTYDNFVSKYIFRQTDRIIVVVKSLIGDLIKINVPRHKIVYIPNAVDLNEFNNYDEEFYEKIKSKDGFLILFVGRLVERKGIHILLKSFQYALKEKLIPKNSRLFIVGDGILRTALKSLSIKLGIYNNVEFTGVVSREKLNSLYKACDVVVVPSLSGETTSLVIQEAIINEKPFIATKIGGILDYEEQGFWGIYVKPGDYSEIAKGLYYIYNSSADLHEKLRYNKKRYINIYSINKMVNKTIDVYKSVLEYYK